MKKWDKMSYNEIIKIENKKLKREYLKKYSKSIRYFVNPLYMSVIRKKPILNHDMSISEILKILMNLNYEKGLSKEDIHNLVYKKRK